jgi:hypothetical protein
MPPFDSEEFALRWRAMSLAEQLGNIGSEVERAFSWRKKGRAEYADNAFDRSLDLLDLTITDARWTGGRRKELCRVREFLCDMVLGNNEYGMTEQFFSQYFIAFAVAARRQRNSQP